MNNKTNNVMRDTRRPPERWDEQLESRRSRVHNPNYYEEVQERIKERDSIQPVYGLFTYAQDFMEEINFCYCRGDDLDSIRERYVIPGLSRYRLLVGEIERYRDQMGSAHFCRALVKPNTAHSAYTLLAWWLCFGVAAADIKELAPYVAPAGEDRLTDTILQRYQPDRVVAEKPSCARSFGVLNQIIDAAPDKRIQLAEKYLATWGKTMGTLKGLSSLGIVCEPGLKSNKELRESHDAQAMRLSYLGFWAWELALVVRFFDIDDSSFADHEFYPRDLAHYHFASS